MTDRHRVIKSCLMWVRQSMIRKSVSPFSEKIMLNLES